MEIYSEIKSLTKYKNTSVVLGTFDGIHIGHQKIIKQAVQLGKKNKTASIVFTFSNHPLEIISPSTAPAKISDNYRKELEMKALGVDILVNIEFTEELAAITSENFIKLLIANFNPQYIITGKNFTFGKNGLGNSIALGDFAKQYHFQTNTPPTVYFAGETVSSTRVRKALLIGDVQLAASLLGHPFLVDGIVEHGDKRGRRLGFPTANIYRDKKYILPADGVYIVQCIWRGKTVWGVANVGSNPTFHDVTRRIEIFLLDFHENIYGDYLHIAFLQRLRGEEKFSSIEALITQMNNDIQKARKIIAQQPWPEFSFYLS